MDTKGLSTPEALQKLLDDLEDVINKEEMQNSSKNKYFCTLFLNQYSLKKLITLILGQIRKTFTFNFCKNLYKSENLYALSIGFH